MPYIEGFVAAVPTANKEKYIEHAREAIAYFKDLGATRLVECWGDDVPKGEVTDFYKGVRTRTLTPARKAQDAARAGRSSILYR